MPSIYNSHLSAIRESFSEDLDNAGEVLYFKNYVNDLERVYYAREYKIKWENTEDRMCAQIEELFFDYSGKK